MVTTIVSMIALRIPCVYWIAGRFGAGAMFFGFIPGWVVGFAMASADFLSGRWTRRILPAEENPEGPL